jgi:pilus assembly protein CpaB
MRNKSVFLLIACVCGTIAAIGVSQWMQAQNVGRTELKTVEIFVTSRSIDVAEEITAEKIKLEQWPADRIPEGSTGNLKDLEGKFAKQRFYAGEPVMPVKLMDDSNSNSSSIPRGYSVVSMKADADGSATNLVSPGDRVDVMAYFTKSDLVPETTAKTVLRGIRVFAIDGKTDREELAKDAKPAKNISLLIHKNDAPVWTYATELGKVRLQLCNPGEYTSASDGDEANVAGQEFLSWLAENQAAKEARKVVEPAPVVSAPELPEKQPRESGFRMLKMSGDKMIEFEFVPGQQVPKVVGETDSHEEVEAEPVDEDSKQLVSDPNDFSYLNGSKSPFYQPRNTDKNGAVPQATPTRSTGGQPSY